MKPKDLKGIFDWENRRPVISDRIFYVPDYYFDHHLFSFPSWEDVQLFGNQNPVSIEFCSGNGCWISKKAASQIEKNWLAVDVRFDRIQKVWSKIKNLSLVNLFAVCSDAWTFSHFYLKNSSVEEVYINFPDPWPKRRHGKHRLMKFSFLDELARILKKGKAVIFVTDDLCYLQETIDLFKSHQSFCPQFPSPYFLTEMDNYGSSWFETMWRQEGRVIYYTKFEKVI